MITENLSTLKIHKLTQAQYDRELASGNIDGNSIYLTPDELDITLTQSGVAADAKAVGDAIAGKQPVGNYLTSYTEADPTVPAWAKASTKPSYTASEVGADASGTANSLITAHNISDNAHADIRVRISSLTNNFDMISEEIDNIKSEGLQQTPLFAESIEECTDPTKLYVLPDGYIYASKKYTEEVVIPGETITTPPTAVIIRGQRYSQSGGKFSAEATCASLVIPTEYYYDSTAGHAITHNLVLTNATFHSSRTSLYLGDDKLTFPRSGSLTKSNTTNATIGCSGGNDYKKVYTILFLAYDGSQTFANTTVTIDGVKLDVIVSDIAADSVKAAHASTTTAEGSTEIVEKEGFVSTGHAFVPADYEDRIIALENVVGLRVSGGQIPAFTNLKDQCSFMYGKRYSVSNGGYLDTTDGSSSVSVPVPAGETIVILRVKNVTASYNYTAINQGASADSFTSSVGGVAEGDAVNGWNQFLDSDGVYTLTITKDAEATYLVITLIGTSASDFTDMIVTVDEPIVYVGPSEKSLMKRVDALEQKVEEDNDTGNIGIVDEDAVVHNAIGTTYPPSQKPAGAEFDGYDIDILNSTADDVHAYIDTVVSGKTTVTKEIMGKDESGNFDIVRYTYANREHIAWVRQNYPKMYAWKNESTVIYSVSVSPRIGDTVYSSTYIGTAYSTVTAVSATNRSRTINGLEFVRYESGDIEPTVIYTDMDDERNSNSTITQNGINYSRYPLGDLGANREKLIPIFIYANEHGIELAGLDENSDRYQKYETKMCALVAARFIRDLAAGKQAKNPFYEFIRENCMVIVVPVTNPFGYNMNVSGLTNASNNGYCNYTGCNINRNYDCPGWDVMNPSGKGLYFGAYPGSENETQYVMNTMVESDAVVAMSLHGLGSWEGFCAHQGQSPDGSDYNRDKLAKVNAFLRNNYGYTLRYYDYESNGVTPAVAVNTPDITSKSPSFITQCGAYGGIVEFSPDDVKTSGWMQEMKSDVIENAYAQTLNLMAMWLSDYLEQ